MGSQCNITQQSGGDLMKRNQVSYKIRNTMKNSGKRLKADAESHR